MVRTRRRSLATKMYFILHANILSFLLNHAVSWLTQSSSPGMAHSAFLVFFKLPGFGISPTKSELTYGDHIDNYLELFRSSG